MFEYNFVFFCWVWEVKNIEDIKSLVPLQEVFVVRCSCICVLFRVTPWCKPKALTAVSGMPLIPHRFFRCIPVHELVLCCSPFSPVAVLCLGSSSYWHLLPFRKLLTLQGEKETQEWVLEKAGDCEEGALSSPWENTLVFLSCFFSAYLCGEPDSDEPNDGYMKKEHKLRILSCSLCSLAWLIIVIRFRAIFEELDSVSINLMVGEGGRNTTQRSLMFLGELAQKYIMNFILCVCTSYLLLWKGEVMSSFSHVFFNVDDRYTDGKTNYQALTCRGFVVSFCCNSCNLLTILSLIEDRYIIYY